MCGQCWFGQFCRRYGNLCYGRNRSSINTVPLKKFRYYISFFIMRVYKNTTYLQNGRSSASLKINPFKGISKDFDQIFGYLSQFLRVFLKPSRTSIISCSQYFQEKSYYYLFVMTASNTLIMISLMKVIC